MTHCFRDKMVADMNRLPHSSVSFLLAAALCGLGGCSSAPTPPAPQTEEKKAPPPAIPISGQSAAFQMYQVARAWGGADIQILKVEDIPIDEVKPVDGKYGAWRATFLAPSKSKIRTFTYSVVDADGGLFKGSRPGNEEAYSASPQIRPFTIQDVKTDSTQALEVAKEQKETQDHIKKNPATPVHYILEWTGQTTVPAWRVIWGVSVGQSDYSVYVDAGSGKYIKKAH